MQNKVLKPKEAITRKKKKNQIKINPPKKLENTTKTPHSCFVTATLY